jgi:hypothetical protein
MGPFDANIVAPPSEAMLDDYMNAAEQLAATAVAELPRLTGCAEADLGTDGCADAFIASFGRRAYRRPLEAEQEQRLRAAFDTGKVLGGFALGVELVVRAALQSPYFLYRVEIGDAVPGQPSVAALDGYELASRLSYFLWDSMPDEELFEAAARGELETSEGIEAQARRMLASEKAEAMVGAFHVQWMGLGSTLEKDRDVFPESSLELAQSMRRATALFATDVVLSGDGTLASLLTSTHAFADERLAALYGVDRTSGDPEALVRVELDPNERGGILTRAGVLAATSHADDTSVVLRGRFLRTFVLCAPLPEPPASVDVSDVGADRTAAACVGCHRLMDPLGEGLEEYDALGRFRTAPAEGSIVDTDVDGPFRGGVELSRRLAESERVRACVARQWFSVALGRPEHVDDAASVTSLDEVFATGDVRELIVALTLTDAFRHHRLEDAP